MGKNHKIGTELISLLNSSMGGGMKEKKAKKFWAKEHHINKDKEKVAKYVNNLK